MATQPPDAPPLPFPPSPSASPPALDSETLDEDTSGPIPPLALVPSEADKMLEASRAAALEGTKIVLELPPAVLAGGRRTTLSFFLAYPSFVRGLRWVPGFRLEKLVIGGKDFGNGTLRVDGRLYYEHRVLKGDTVSLHVLNTTKEDRNFKGSMTVEISRVVEDDDYACSPTEPSPSSLDTAGSSPSGVLSCVPAT